MTLRHIIIDIETLATSYNAVVLSIACVPFELETHTLFKDLIKTGFCVKLNVQDQVKNYNRSIENSTMTWWKSQPKETFDAIVRPSSEDKNVKDGLILFNKFVSNIPNYDFKKSYVWSRGNNFDFPILKSLYNDAGLGLPYNDWKVRDVRTAIDILAGTDNGQYQLKIGNEGFIAHDPLHDAAMDAARLNELFYMAIHNEEIEIPF